MQMSATYSIRTENAKSGLLSARRRPQVGRTRTSPWQGSSRPMNLAVRAGNPLGASQGIICSLYYLLHIKDKP